MSTITRCPACSTVFKVVADQLKVSGGWVRCGHCSEVFDAQAYAQSTPTLQAAAVMSPAPVPTPTATVAATAPTTPSLQPSESLPPGPVPSVLPSGFSPSQLPPSEWVPDSKWTPDPALYSAGDSSLWGSASAQAAPAPVITFVRKAQGQAFWRSPVVRAGLLLCCMGLLGLLSLQVAVFERDRIVAMQPSTKPFLQTLCSYAECELHALRQIDSLTIDSSSFNKLQSGAYRLSVVLKNDSALELATPSLELALTDSQDQALVRRVLTPEQLGAANSLSANAEWSGGTNLQLDKSASPGLANITGYRVRAFYP